MTIINTNSISGINSITAQGSSGVAFYDSSGSSERLRITSGGDVNIGPSANANGHGLLTLSQSASAAFNALVIQQGNTAFTATDGLQIGIDAGVNAYFKLYENRDFYFTTGTSNTEKLRITAGGSVGIGTETPRSIANFGSLGINGVSGAFTDYFLNGTRTGTTAVDSNGFACEAVGSSTPFRVITNGTEKLSITSAGKLILPTGSPGIQFGSSDTGTNITSQTLDDYEEGTHTTVFADSGTGTITVSGGNDQLSYIKIGNLVNVIGRPLVGSVSSPTGYFSMTLPFTTADVADAGARSAAAINIRLVNAGYDVGLFSAQVSENSNTLSFNYGGSNDGTASGPAMKAGTQIWINITYRVA